MLIVSALAASFRIRLILLIAVTALPLYCQSAARQLYSATSPVPSIPVSVKNVIATIQPAGLKGDLSFLASDALEGRYTPSAGLDVAAEFIASQFRAAGLKPAGNQDYFQIAPMVDRKMPKPKSSMTFQSEGADVFTVPVDSISVTNSSSAVTLERCPVVVLKDRNPDTLKGLDLAGKVVVAPGKSVQSLPPAERASAYSRMQAFDKAVKNSEAKALVLVGRVRPAGHSLLTVEEVQQSKVAVLSAVSDDLQKWIDNPGDHTNRTISFAIPAPEDQKVQLKNVIGILPGSDPKLRNTFVMLTAHYDHIGTLETGKDLMETKTPKPGDRIFNGANDDGSGTVSVIEIAKALARLHPRPKRSIVFMTFFGEERGLIGSSYYGQHPLVSIADTVADLNLEQVGRTDSTEGKQVNTASLTGYDYSDVTKYLEKAGRLTGVKVYLNKTASDDYFVRSDNAALAILGVPAHTLCVAFDYPDYHGLDDEWQKVDYENMARVDRMVALALLNIANNPVAPKWNSDNAKTASFREAQTQQKH